MERLIGLAEREMGALKALSIWSMLWALVRLEVPVQDAFLDKLAERIERRFRELPLPPTHIVTGVVWAYARLRMGRAPTETQVCSAQILMVFFSQAPGPTAPAPPIVSVLKVKVSGKSDAHL